MTYWSRDESKSHPSNTSSPPYKDALWHPESDAMHLDMHSLANMKGHWRVRQAVGGLKPSRLTTQEQILGSSF